MIKQLVHCTDMRGQCFSKNREKFGDGIIGYDLSGGTIRGTMFSKLGTTSLGRSCLLDGHDAIDAVTIYDQTPTQLCT